MRIEYLREFVVFAKHLNFSAASKELMMTQPGLSNHIKSLEDELGATLVNRRPPVQLTDAGRIFLAGIQRVLFDCDAVVEKTRAAVGPKVIKIQGSLPGYAVGDAAPIEGYTPIYVNTDLHDATIEGLENGEVDLLVLVSEVLPEMHSAIDADPHLEVISVGEDRLSLAMERDNPLAKKEALSREDLQRTDIVIFGGSAFDAWKSAVSQVVGEDIQLRFRLDPMRKIDDVGSADLMGSIYICQNGYIDKHFRNRDDIVVFEEVDGHPLVCNIAFVFDKRNQRARDFAKKLLQ